MHRRPDAPIRGGRAVVVIGLLALLAASKSQGRVTGQWDFDNGDLSATVGVALQYRGTTGAQTLFGSTTDFGIPDIGGQPARVMRFPACAPSQGYVVTHGIAPNGGGVKANQYTFLLDVLFPAGSAGYRALLQTDPGNTTDADLFVNGSHGIGISGVYHGNLAPGTWHRVAFVLDLTVSASQLRKFIDGALVGVQTLSSGVDGRWSLDRTALLFADENGETGVGYVNSIQFHDRALTAQEISALGGPTSDGLPPDSQPPSAAVVQYDFDGTLLPTTPGRSLETGAAAPAAVAGVLFTNATIAGQTAQVAAFSRGTFFRMTHGLAANGGGSYLNQYTLILDVMFPSRPTGWAALWQTSPGNGNDGDWFINPAGGVGISGVYGGNVPDGAWHRLALVVDGVGGTLTSYVNGVQVQQLSGVTLDGRWSLDSTALLFADEDQENAAGYVNSVQLRAGAMSAADVAALGGPAAAGIPLPVMPSELRLLAPNGGETFTAGSTQTVAWVVNNPGGLVQIDLLIGDLVYRTIGQVPMRLSNHLWAVPKNLGDTNTYRIRLTSLAYPGLQDTSDAPFSVTGSGAPPNLLFGRPLQQNGGFEMGLTNWQVVTGGPVVLTAADGKGAPWAGAAFLHGGTGAAGDMILRQDIDLLAAGFSEDDLDNGAVVEAEARLRNALPTGTFDDQVWLRVAAMDAAGRELGRLRTLVADSDTWTRRALTGLLPAGTRTLRVELVGSHRRDTANDSMADEVVVRLQQVELAVSPRITKLPVLQDYRQDAMTLLWETDGNLAPHAVDWGRESVAEAAFTQVESLQIDGSHFVHRATLTGLQAETRYVYRVRSGETVSGEFSFRTAPRRDTPFAVAWWADSQENPAVLQLLIPIMLARGVDWLGVPGDLASNGSSLSDWHNYWFTPLQFRNIAQSRPVLFARGNHDGEGALGYAYSALPGNGAWYAFDYGNSRFIFLDSEAPTGAVPEQYAWLTNELSRPETRNAAFRVVCFHKCPFANLWNGGGYTGESWVRTDWVPLFRQHGVDLVINGHAHNYNRGTTNGVVYLIVGGGGGALDTERVASWPLFTVEYSRYHFGLMRIEGELLSWDAYDEDGLLLDHFVLRSRRPHLTLVRGSGTVNLELSGRPGAAYAVERSSTLTQWTAFTTNVLSEAGPPVATNHLPAEHERQFFRARLLP